MAEDKEPVERKKPKSKVDKALEAINGPGTPATCNEIDDLMDALRDLKDQLGCPGV